MHNVYAHGLLNLAASTAPDGDGGLFRDREPHITCRSISKLNLPRGGVILIPEPDILAASVTCGPLAKRGWVLQEQLLASRVLHFGEQLFWECAEMWACETLSDGLTDTLNLLGDPWYFSIRRRILGITRSTTNIHWLPSAQQKFLYEVWDSICMEYSRRELKEPGDKLIAFAGIMKRFKSLLSADDYMFGLWKGDLIPGLLWFADGLKSRCKAVAGPRIPSWSWLSQDGEISYSSKERRYGYNLANLESLSMDESANDPSDSPQGGFYVMLFGVLHSAYLRCSGLNSPGHHSYDILFDNHIALSSGGLGRGTNLAKILLDDEDPIESGTCYLLPLVISEDEDRRLRILHGIILNRPSSDGGDTYHRMGYFEATTFTRFFYEIEVSSTAPVAGNPWDSLDSYPQMDNEMTPEQRFLDHVNESVQPGEFISCAQLQSFLGSYLNRIFRPLKAQMIPIS